MKLTTALYRQLSVVLSIETPAVRELLAAQTKRHSSETCLAVRFYAYGISDGTMRYSVSRVEVMMFTVLAEHEPELITTHDIIRATTTFVNFLDSIGK